MGERLRIEIGFLEHETIAGKADELLARYGRSDEVPVDVEMVVERDLGLDVIPVPGLRDLAGAEGSGGESFTDGQAIYVDQWVMQHREARHRFSLAHELGHLVLHGDVLDAYPFSSIADWKDFMNRVDLRDHIRMEFQANAFAGCLLVPRKHLEREVRRTIPELEETVRQAEGPRLPARPVSSGRDRSACRQAQAGLQGLRRGPPPQNHEGGT